MKICFLARPSYDRFSSLIYKDMKNRYDNDLKGFFITSNKKETEYIKQNVPDGICCEVAAFMKEHWDSFSLEDLVEMEKKYSCEPVWKYIYTDRFLINRPYDYVVKITDGLFRFFEKVFTENEIQFYYSETTATLQCYVAYLIGKKIGVRYLCQMDTRLLTNYHYMAGVPFEEVIGFDSDYLEIQYSKDEIKKAEDFLNNFEMTYSEPSYMKFNTQEPHLRLKDLALPIWRIVKSFDPQFRDKYAYMYFQGNKSITNPLLFYCRYQSYKKLYKQPDYSKKFVYFPLHYQPEASTLVCAQKYEKQLFFIDSWAKSLPADTLLYVKEHYALIGHRESGFYKELKKYPNVVLIDPFVKSKDMIMNAVAVTTLTGTAGLEAVLLRKPVFISGNTFFDNAPGVIKVDDIYGNYLRLISCWKQPDRNEVVKYLCEYFRHVSLGGTNNSDEETYSEKNINFIADSLWREILRE